jgi:hypothetical protein
MSNIYLIRKYGILNMCETVILDCYIRKTPPKNSVEEGTSDVDSILTRSGNDVCITYERINLDTIKAE